MILALLGVVYQFFLLHNSMYWLPYYTICVFSRLTYNNSIWKVTASVIAGSHTVGGLCNRPDILGAVKGHQWSAIHSTKLIHQGTVLVPAELYVTAST